MKTPLLITGAICALALVVVAFVPQIPAQSSGGGTGKGVFGSLKAGQMVEYTNDAWGYPVITTYEDDEKKPLMRHKIKEVGHDYVVLEFDDREASGAFAESRISAYHLSMVAYVGKARGKGAPGDLDDRTKTKPGPKKK